MYPDVPSISIDIQTCQEVSKIYPKYIQIPFRLLSTKLPGPMHIQQMLALLSYERQHCQQNGSNAQVMHLLQKISFSLPGNKRRAGWAREADTQWPCIQLNGIVFHPFSSPFDQATRSYAHSANASIAQL